MLNEVIKFRKSLEDWGVTIPQQDHPLVKLIPKSGRHVLATLMDDGEVEFADFDVQNIIRKYYFESNHFTALTIKHSTDKPRERLQNRLMNQVQLAERLSPANELPLLNNLANLISAVDIDLFFDGLCRFLGVYKGDVYISLDVDGVENIQTENFFNLLNERLRVGVGNSNEFDAWGLPSDGADSPFLPEQGIRLFCKNRDNECYSRFGMNSVEACPLGGVARQKIKDTLSIIKGRDHEATREHPGVWYRHFVKKGKDKYERYLVLSTMFPTIDPIQDMSDECDISEWEGRVTAAIRAMRDQEHFRPDTQGIVIIVKTPDKGQASVCYSQSMTCSELSEYTKRWHEGSELSGNVSAWVGVRKPITLKSLVFYMNRGHKRTEADRENRREVDPLYFNLQDAYDFFAGRSDSVDKFCRFYASKKVPVMLYWAGDCDNQGRRKFPYDRNYLIPIRNLIAHKKGIKEENLMENWAYVLGRVYQRADWLYTQFFDTRGSNVPLKLIGGRYAQMACSNPRSAHAQFTQVFRSCLNYCEGNRNKIKGLAGYKALVTKLNELSGGNLPTSMTDVDKICLDMGYNHYSKKGSNDD